MDMEERVSYIGTVQSKSEVRLIAQTQGTVRTLPVSEGGSFSTGDLLVQISAPEIEASVQRLTAERDYWKRHHETDTRLVEKGALAPEQAQSSERAYRSASAALSEAQAQLAKTALTAPFSGVVLNWFVQPGQPVMPGQPLLLIGDGRREVHVDVVEEDLGRGIRPGIAVDLYPGDGEPLRSELAEIAPVSTGQTRAFRAKIPLTATGIHAAGLRKGSSIRAEFLLRSQKHAVTVPVQAVVDRDSSPHLFLITDGKAVSQSVTVGIAQRGRVAVDFPWNGSDRVATTNLGSLTDGTVVYAVEVKGGVQ